MKIRTLTGWSPSTFYWQLAIFLAGFLIVAGLAHTYFKMADDLGERTANERDRLHAGEEIVDCVQEIEKDFYRLVSTTGVAAQQRISRIILAKIAKLEHDLSALHKGGTVTRISPLNLGGRDEFVRQIHLKPMPDNVGYPMAIIEISPYLDIMRNTVSDLGKMLERREADRLRRDMPRLLSDDQDISRYVKTVPPLFYRINENANRMLLESSTILKSLEDQIRRERERYHLFADITIVLVIISVMMSGFLFFRHAATASRRLNEALDEMRRARDEAEQASRAKSQFLANMSHEVRTPMNGVLGMLHALQGFSLEPSQMRLVRMAYKSGEKLLAVINDILDFSKIEAGKLELHSSNFSLPELIEDVFELILAKAGDKKILFRHDVGAGVPDMLKGDVLRLRQILINLLDNASKFTAEGEISLSVCLEDENAGEVLLRFAVKDSGLGMPPDKLSQIFEPFCQVDGSMSRRFEGTGLGLAISSQLVQMMGGTVGVESSPGRGSLFWFTISLTRGETEPVPADAGIEKENIAPLLHRRLRILMAEDNPVNQEVGRLMLEGVGCEVDIVDNGRLAVEAISARGYDLVFMDCQMPEVDGYEAARIIRQREGEADGERGRIPIIALTAHAMEGDRDICIAAGMDDYLSKPFNSEQILALLRNWFPQRQIDQDP